MKMNQILAIGTCLCFTSSSAFSHETRNLYYLKKISIIQNNADNTPLPILFSPEAGGSDMEPRENDLDPDEIEAPAPSLPQATEKEVEVPEIPPGDENAATFDDSLSQVEETKKEAATVSFMTGAFVVISALLFFAGLAAAKTAEGKHPPSTS